MQARKQSLAATKSPRMAIRAGAGLSGDLRSPRATPRRDSADFASPTSSTPLGDNSKRYVTVNEVWMRSCLFVSLLEPWSVHAREFHGARKVACCSTQGEELRAARIVLRQNADADVIL